MLRLPFLTLTVTMLLIAVYAVTGPRTELLQGGLSRLHERHALEPKVAALLAEVCAREAPADGSCLAAGGRAARFALAASAEFPADARERALVEAFREAPRGVYELPAYQAFREAWAAEREELAGFAAREEVLLGRHWSWRAAFWSLWEHASLPHLLFNVLNLVVFGVLVEWLAGKRAWLLGYFGAGLASTAAFAAVIPHELTITLGASPAVYGLMGVYMVHFVEDLPSIRFENPRRQLLYYGAAAYVGLDLAAQGFILGEELFPLHFTAFLAGFGIALVVRALGLRRPVSLPDAYALEGAPLSLAS